MILPPFCGESPMTPPFFGGCPRMALLPADGGDLLPLPHGAAKEGGATSTSSKDPPDGK